jgi:hypothetical protein
MNADALVDSFSAIIHLYFSSNNNRQTNWTVVYRLRHLNRAGALAGSLLVA